MYGRRIVLLCVAMLTSAGSLTAQDEDASRLRLPERAPTAAEAAKLLSLRQAKNLNEELVRRMMKDVLDGKFDTDLLKQLQQQVQDDPTLKRQVEQKLLDQPELRQQVQDLIKQQRPNPEKLRDILRDLNPPRVTPMNPPDQPERPDLPRPDRLRFPDQKWPQPQPQQIPQPLPPTTPGSQNKNSASTNDWLTKQTNEWANSWTRNLRNLDNTTLKGILERLNQSGLTPSKVELPDWIKNATRDIKVDLKTWVPNLTPPQALRDSLGNLRPSPGNWNLGSPSLPSTSAGQGLGWLLLVALAIFVAWLFWWLGGFRSADTRDPKAIRTLGPCAVAPDQVTTRGQVVLCFEHLARRILGLPAETSHHHEVGRQLAERAANTQQEQAADELATLYEHARYLPPTENLPPQDLARARQALRLIATVDPA